jgi:hypothetical protein
MEALFVARFGEQRHGNETHYDFYYSAAYSMATLLYSFSIRQKTYKDAVSVFLAVGLNR